MIDRRFGCAVWGFGTVVFHCLTCSSVRAQDLGTNQMAVMLPPATLELDQTSMSDDWGGRFRSELLKNQNLLFDRLGPPSGFEWAQEAQFLKYGVHQALALSARAAFERVLEDSARETALAMLPVTEWMEILPLERWQDFGERLLQGSFGNTAEQEVGDLPTTYSASESWWRNAGRDGTFRYGIRPRMQPYIYMASEVGHFDDRPLLSLEARARYLLFDRFQTSLAATAPLPYALELSLGALCEPMQFSRTRACALRLQRVVGSGVSACAVFLGASHSAGQTTISFGLSRLW